MALHRRSASDDVTELREASSLAFSLTSRPQGQLAAVTDAPLHFANVRCDYLNKLSNKQHASSCQFQLFKFFALGRGAASLVGFAATFTTYEGGEVAEEIAGFEASG